MAADRGRYAPSPTGRLHLGNARTALLAWLDARSRGGAFIMRVEDLDRARVPAGAEQGVLEDLAWLGIDWDEGPDRGGPFAPYRQSERGADYDAAIDRLLADGRAFPCACSRADVARAAQAPHEADEDGPRYPGTCRGAAPDEVRARAAAQGRAPAIRFAGDGARIDFVDEVHGAVAGGRGGHRRLRPAARRRNRRLSAGRGRRRRGDGGDARRPRRRSAALDAAPARAVPRARAARPGVRPRAAGADAVGRAARQADAPGGRRRPARARHRARNDRRRAGGLRRPARHGRQLSGEGSDRGFLAGADRSPSRDHRHGSERPETDIFPSWSHRAVRRSVRRGIGSWRSFGSSRAPSSSARTSSSRSRWRCWRASTC